jgi:dihydropteroate synthase
MSSYWQTTHGHISLQNKLFLGILNITPDSFSDGNLYTKPNAAISQILHLVDIGANIIDIGAESTRPGATIITPDAEWNRLEPIIKIVQTEIPHIPISLDTRHALVATRGLAAGVAIINDISGFQDPKMLQAVKNSSCGLIAMRSRIRGGKNIMPPYDQMGNSQPDEAIGELKTIKNRLIKNNINKERILLDPGFGFGTSFVEDSAIWNSLKTIPKILDWPIERFCIGLSRKRFLAWRSGNTSIPPIGRDELTTQAHREAIALGYRVFRTHAAMQ